MSKSTKIEKKFGIYADIILVLVLNSSISLKITRYIIQNSTITKLERRDCHLRAT